MPELPIWAQTTGSPGAETVAIVVRRFLVDGSLVVPGQAGWLALLLVAAGLGVLLGLMLIQRDPPQFWFQLLDLGGHLRALQAGAQLLARNRRMPILLGAGVVLSWIGYAVLVWDRDQGLADLDHLDASYGPTSLGLQLGLTAGLMPLRDLLTLGNHSILFLLAFLAPVPMRAAAARPAGPGSKPGGFTPSPSPGHPLASRSPRLQEAAPGSREPDRVPAQAVFLGMGLILLLACRLGLAAAAAAHAPPSVPIQCIVVLTFVLGWLADALLLSWVLHELHGTVQPDRFWTTWPITAILAGLPTAVLMCLVLMPIRVLLHIETSVVELSSILQPPPPAISDLPIWIGLVLQLLAWIGLGLPATAAATGQWRIGPLLRAYGGFLRRAAGRVVGLLGVTAALAIAGVALLAWVLLAMTREKWTLVAIDSYAHYWTLALGLISLAGLTTLDEERADRR